LTLNTACCQNLIAINVVLWLASIVVPGIFMKWGLNVDLTDILGFALLGIFQIQSGTTYHLCFYAWWTWSFFFNMFALYMFGGVLEQLWGTKRFLFYYLITGVGAGLVQSCFGQYNFIQ